MTSQEKLCAQMGGRGLHAATSPCGHGETGAGSWPEGRYNTQECLPPPQWTQCGRPEILTLGTGPDPLRGASLYDFNRSMDL